MKKKAGLFDLDGVIFDTEGQYTQFWSEEGKLLQESSDFSARIKGRTLKEILDRYFPDQKQADEVIKRLSRFEQEMVIEYIPGAREFILGLKEQGVKLAIVTSSNDLKMQNVYRLHPEVKKVFDVIITADKITRSKPDPECYLLAARELGMKKEECVVFEDSFSGLEAGRRAEMKVVGLATSNPAEKIADKADVVVPDFRGLSFTDILN
ncbi:HAD family hydrolase [Culturomica massiliensis]|jgi:beta-phosphoglucomutase|uniref:HAD family hydrolase n=1 Tax=Culturomica massiliensis TaxID=1841857 RepID=UPI0003377451|nr:MULTISPECIES: HAD-IA family hydrolase [Odoribacteraceae]RHV93652.1 HAD family hydrolase [Odoribacter sp. OF09-27XD]CCZ10049.1 hAD hydrolase family IA [Odoribacter sp. CAG:788]